MFRRELLFKGFLSTFPFFVFLVVCLALSLTGYAQGYTSCTDDALVCEDGTVVGRTGPNCEFAPCPEGEIPDTFCTKEKVCDVDGTCSFFSSCDEPDEKSAEVVVQGVRHPLVLEVQNLLNKTTCLVAKFGAGSPGRETDYFGPKTHAALRCYVSLVGGDYSGVITDSFIAGLSAHVKKYAKTPILVPSENIDPGFYDQTVLDVLTFPKQGTRHPWVLEAQKLLNKTPCLVARSGAGSPGQETDYFGSKTHAALRCYVSLVGGDYSGVITDSLIVGLSAYVKKYFQESILVPSSSYPYDINTATIDGDMLLVNVSYSGGCKKHVFTLDTDGGFLESYPVQVLVRLLHDANGDTCEARLTEELQFDLTPLKTIYQRGYRRQEGTIIIRLEGAHESNLVYEF